MEDFFAYPTLAPVALRRERPLWRSMCRYFHTTLPTPERLMTFHPSLPGFCRTVKKCVTRNATVIRQAHDFQRAFPTDVDDYSLTVMVDVLLIFLTELTELTGLAGFIACDEAVLSCQSCLTTIQKSSHQQVTLLNRIHLLEGRIKSRSHFFGHGKIKLLRYIFSVDHRQQVRSCDVT